MADPASVTRTNKILIGTVAALSASVIAVSPAAQTSATMVVHEAQLAQQRAVALVAEVTDSPLTVYGDLVDNTVGNVTSLIKQYAASPFPILGAIASNQIGYLQRIFDFDVVKDAFLLRWNTGTGEMGKNADGSYVNLQQMLQKVATGVSTGDFGSAFEWFNKFTLFSLQGTVLPWLNNWLFSSTTKKGVPEQILQNLTNAVGKVFTTGTIVFGAFQALYAPISGATFELSRALGSTFSALTSGNLVGALTALVNTPGAVLNAALNGFDYVSGDATGTWAGLLSWKDPSCTARSCSAAGTIQSIFVNIAKSIATAIKNVTTASSTAATTAAVAAAGTTPSTSGIVADTLGVNTTSYTLSLDAAAKSTTDGAAAGKTATTDSADIKAGTDATAAGETKTEDTTKVAAADTTAAKAADTASEAGTTGAADDTKAATAGGTSADTSTKGSTSEGSSSSSDSAGSDGSSTGKSSKRSAKHDSAKSGSAKSDSAGSASDSSAKSGAAKHDSAKHDSAKSGSAKSGSGKNSSGKHGSSKRKSSSSS